jgi:hypothetical protein
MRVISRQPSFALFLCSLSEVIFLLFPPPIQLRLLLSQGVDVESRNPRGNAPERERFKVLSFGKKQSSYPLAVGFKSVVRNWCGPKGRSQDSEIDFSAIVTSNLALAQDSGLG